MRKKLKRICQKLKNIWSKIKKPVLIVLLGVLLPIGLFFISYSGKIYPGIYVAGFEVSGKTPDEIIPILENQFPTPQELALTSSDSDSEKQQTFKINLDEVKFSYNLAQTADRVYLQGRSGNLIYDWATIFKALTQGLNLGLTFNWDEEALNEQVSVISGQVEIEPVYPQAKIVQGKVEIVAGKKGAEINPEQLRTEIGQALALVKKDPVQIPTQIIDPSLNKEQQKTLQERAEKLIGKSLTLKFEYENFAYSDKELVQWLDPYEPKGYPEDNLEEIIQEISQSINRSAQNPTFVFKAGRVQEFAPAKEGVAVKTEELNQLLIQAIEKLETTEEKFVIEKIPYTATPPELTTDKVNDLGIRELIGRGTSTFRGSISSRVYNINLAADRLNGILIKPGEVFSFNAALGEVDKLTGYKEAYVIKEGKTVLGDGGGVCQVSTTFFRAALDAGLPIIERQAHAYRVGYYEQDSAAGLDATVYEPTTDLKIKNDTPGHILIQTIVNNKNYSLVFEFYGTSDGRVATTTKPVVWDITPPPEDVYIDDPTLPAGTIKQIDWKAWGAKAKFNYQVTRDGEIIYEKTFYSTYRPWAAKFLRGTGPVN